MVFESFRKSKKSKMTDLGWPPCLKIIPNFQVEWRHQVKLRTWKNTFLDVLDIYDRSFVAKALIISELSRGHFVSSPFFVKMKKFELYCATFDILHFVYHHVLFFYYDTEETNFSKVNGIKRRILPISFGFSKPLGCVPFSRSKSAFCRQNWIDFSFHLDLNRYLKGYMHAKWYVHAKWCMV